MDTSHKFKEIKPRPPDFIDTKSLGVWHGWSKIGDREAAREAATKGTHIDLVVKFLATRNGLDIYEAEKWFRDEIHSWVLHLLTRNQVFKASHILKNINVDPIAEMLSVFLDTTFKELRENLGNHLLKNDKLDDDFINSWRLLKIIEDNYAILVSLKEKYIAVNVHLINQQSNDWKNKMGTELLFQTFDFSLESFVQADCAWRYLLKANVNLIKLWINVRFGNTITIEICDINIDVETVDKLNSLFSKLPITQNMIDLITDFDLNERVQNSILNELCGYGIFNTIDKNTLINIIRRLIETNNLENIHVVVKKPYSTIDQNHLQELLINYCVTNGLYTVLNACTQEFVFSNDLITKLNSKFLSAMVDVRNMCKNLDDELILRDNIFEIAQLCNENLQEYFTSFPMVLLAVVTFTKDVSIDELLSGKVSIKVKDFLINGEFMRERIETLPFFKSLSRVGVFGKSCLTHYNLLAKHANLNIKTVYAFRFTSGDIPHFNSDNLVRKYGYNKEVNYSFFLKRCRPSYACKVFMLNRENSNLQYEYNVVCKKIFKIAVNNFLRREITTSCLAFLEMIGVDCYVLRLYVKVANIIYNTVQKNESLIKDLFNKIDVNCERIFNMLEQSVMSSVNLNKNSTGSELIDALINYNVVVKFSSTLNLKLPELFLQYCAENDLWLPFIIYVQIYQYPFDVICKLIQNFQSVALIEHLTHCVSNDIQLDDAKSQLLGERDARKYFLSKIGFRILDTAMIQSSPEVSLASYSSYGSMSASTGSDFLDSETLDFKTDVLQTLIKCHNSTDPPKALLQAARYYKCPIMTVLANSYEPDSVITNWVMWLIISCDLDDLFTYYDGLVITADSVIELFKRVLEKRFFKTLQNSFNIFFPDNPLRVFIDFLHECIRLHFDLELLTEKLNLFKTQIKFTRRSSVLTEVDNDMSYFDNKVWIQIAAILLLSMIAQHAFDCRHNQIRFFDTLIRLEITKYFCVPCPNFNTIVTILRYLSANHCDINLDLSVIYDEDKFRDAVKKCIDDLLDEKRYVNALNVAKIINISSDFILIREIKDEFADRNLKKFWVKWNEVFQDLRISPSTAVKFYVECAEQIENKSESFEVLKLARRWAYRHKLGNLVEVEESMWMAYFHLDDCSKKVELDCGDSFLYVEFLKELEDLPVNNITLNETEMKSLEKAIEDMLNVGDVYTALRLENVFGYSNEDLDIIKLCLGLVEGIVLSYQLNARQRLLLNKRSNTRGLKTRRRTYLSSRLSSSDNVVTPIHDTLALLEMLTENLKNGVQIALKILMTYRISTKIDKTYREVVECEDPMNMLREAFKRDCENKLEVLSDFAHVYKLSKEDIADFLCEEIIIAATEYSKSKIDISFLWDMNADADFNLVLQLLPDNCTILGLKLYSYASALHKSRAEAGAEFNLDEIVLVIELLIRSHDCFTADCNMEGISILLKKSQVIISLLINLRNWKLIVRLLTGIARYSEMDYVFQILRENDQFELLLRKGSRKDNGLKVALLQYLKKYCPDDIELYKIVALHFFLFSEIATLWEEESESIVKRLITLSKLEMQNNKINPETEPYVLFVNSDDTKKFLNKIMNNYKHAAEYHLHGEKLSKAMNAAKQAQLLALQLSLVKDSGDESTCVCLLNLSNVQISLLISSQLSFPQTSILTDAYNYEVDWASVLFEQCIVKTDSQYLCNFMLSFPLTGTLVQDISSKFLSTNMSQTLIANMKDVLSKLPSIHSKYRIASELGFSDVLETLLDGNRLAFLKDTVWKKGYKNCKD